MRACKPPLVVHRPRNVLLWPVEFDGASVPDDVSEHYMEVDQDLLSARAWLTMRWSRITACFDALGLGSARR